MTAEEVRRGIVKWIAQAAVGVVGYAAVIFISAGTLHWVWGWALVIVLAVVLIPGLFLAGLFVLRTQLEDKTLTAELSGYKAYSQETPYRLLPGLW